MALLRLLSRRAWMWSGSFYACVARVRLDVVYEYALSSLYIRDRLGWRYWVHIPLRTWSPVFGLVPIYQEKHAFAGKVFSLFFFFPFFLCVVISSTVLLPG